MLLAVKNTAFNNVYVIKKYTYCTPCPHVGEMENNATRQIQQPISIHSIQGLAFPIRVCVLSIKLPKNTSDTPSKHLDTIISMPMTAGSIPIASVR